MLGFKLNHVNKRGQMTSKALQEARDFSRYDTAYGLDQIVVGRIHRTLYRQLRGSLCHVNNKMMCVWGRNELFINLIKYQKVRFPL